MDKSLRVTDYSNFKDLSYFISQHKKALGMMEEVQNFYLSFLKSKLIHSYEISKWPGKLIVKKTTDTLVVYVSEYTNPKVYQKANKIYTSLRWPEDTSLRNGVKGEIQCKENAAKAVEDALVGKKFILNLNDKNYIDANLSKTPCEVIDILELKESSWDQTIFNLILEVKLPFEVDRYSWNYHEGGVYYASLLSDAGHSISKRDGVNYKKDLYINQDKYKLEIERLAKKEGKSLWYIEMPDTSIRYFGTDSDLTKFNFSFGPNPLKSYREEFKHSPNWKKYVKDNKEYLIIQKSAKSSGNRKDRWKTFYEVEEHITGAYFNISNGNLVEPYDFVHLLERRQLDVNNGWHPELDD